jgi:hypothetical protein
MNALGTAALLTAIAASIPVARELSRTTRLRSAIRGNLDLLAALPADHSQCEHLAACIEDQLRELVAREQRRLIPDGWQAAFWFSWLVWLSLLEWVWFRDQMGWEPGTPAPGWGKLVAGGALILASAILAARAVVRRRLD